MNTAPDTSSNPIKPEPSDLSASEPPGRPAQTGILKLFLKRTQALTIDAFAIGVLAELCAAIICASCFPEVIENKQIFLMILATAFVAGVFDCCTGLLLLSTVGLMLLSLITPSILGPFVLPQLLPVTILVASMVVNASYHIASEVFTASTIGKKIAGLKVADKKGEPLSIWRALLRHTLKGVSVPALLLVPVTWLAFCNRNQMLHDKVVGTIIDTNSAINFRKEYPNLLSQDEPKRSQLKGAGIPRRVVSAITDALIYYVADAVSFCGLSYLIARFTPENFGFVPSPFEPAAAFTLYCTVAIPALCLPAILFALFESSSLQATPGKIIAGLKVVNLNGEPIRFWQALMKQFMQSCVYMSLVIFAFITLMIMKDRLSIGSVAIGFAFYLCYGAIFCWTFDNQQTLFDRLTKRFVVNDIPSNVLEATTSGATQ